MTVTPQTNTTLEAIAEELLKAEQVTICGHVSPDGDCIGSELALRSALLRLGKQVDVLLAKPDSLEPSFEFLPGSDELQPARRYRKRPEVFVAVDVPNEERLGDAAAVKKKAKLTITIDHHAVPARMSDMSYTDPDAAATCLLIWQLCKHMGVDRSGDVAVCTYSGLVTDTGRFQYQNTNAECFEQAAEMVKAGADPSFVSKEFFQRRSVPSIELEGILIGRLQLICDGAIAISWITHDDMEKVGAVKADCEPLVNVLRSIDGVRVCCILRDEGDRIRGSFRAKDDTDVSALARDFNGGGHRAAAGFTMFCSLEEAKSKVIDALESVSGNGACD